MTSRRRAVGKAVLVIVVGIGIVGIVYSINENRKASSRAPFLEMKNDLTGVWMAEDRFFDLNGRYTANLEPFHSFPRVRKPSIIVSKEGYSATVTHTQLPNVVCGIGMGVRNPVADVSDRQVACRHVEK